MFYTNQEDNQSAKGDFFVRLFQTPPVISNAADGVSSKNLVPRR
jgi:hypothetical protein